MRDRPTVDTRWPRPGIALVVLAGEHDLGSVDRIDSAVERAFELRCAHLVVDVTGTTFLDSSVINSLLQARRRADANAVPFNLVLGSSPIVERALEGARVLPYLNRVVGLDALLGPAQPGERA